MNFRPDRACFIEFEAFCGEELAERSKTREKTSVRAYRRASYIGVEARGLPEPLCHLILIRAHIPEREPPMLRHQELHRMSVSEMDEPPGSRAGGELLDDRRNID